MAIENFEEKNIQDTFQRVVQTDGTNLADGTGSIFTPVSSSHAITASHALFAISASHETTFELSSSHAQTASQVGSFTAANIGQTYDTVANVSQGNIRFTELDNGTDNLALTNLGVNGTPTFDTITLTKVREFFPQINLTALDGLSGANSYHLRVLNDSEIAPGISLGSRNENIISFIKQEGTIIANINQEGEFSGNSVTATTAFTASTVTILDFGIDVESPVVFNNEDGGLLDNTGIFTYNSGKKRLSIPFVSSTHVTASGNISASGDVYAESIILPFGQAINWGSHDGNHIRVDESTGNIIFDTLPVQMQNGLDVSGANGHITASGNISSSGVVAGNSITVAGSDFINLHSSGYRVNGNSGPLNLFGNVTASGDISSTGNISSSGAIRGNLFQTDGDLVSIGSGLMIREETYGGIGSTIVQPTSTLSVVGDLYTNSHITASGDISSSSTVYVKGSTTSGVYVNNENALGTSPTATEGSVFGGTSWTGIHVGRSSTPTKNIMLHGPVTASGNISSSGTGSFTGGGIFGLNSAVGIGTTSPSHTLDVQARNGLNSVARFKSTDDKALIIIEDDDTAFSLISKDAKFHIGTGSTDYENFTVWPAEKRVGINTTAPGQALEVVGNISASGDLTVNEITASGNILSLSAIQSPLYNSTTSATGYKLTGAKVMYTQASPYSATVFGRDASVVISGSSIALGNIGDVNTHVTASGDISASGNIYSDNIETFWNSFSCNGDSSFASSAYGPNTHGMNFYTWNRNWTDTTGDGGNPTGDHVHKSEINTGWYVPYKIKIVELVGGFHDGNAASTVVCKFGLWNTAASLKDADYDSNTGTTKEFIVSGSCTLNENRWRHFSETCEVELDEGQYVLPRIIMGEDINNLRGQFTIKYKRCK